MARLIPFRKGQTVREIRTGTVYVLLQKLPARKGIVLNLKTFRKEIRNLSDFEPWDPLGGGGLPTSEPITEDEADALLFFLERGASISEPYEIEYATQQEIQAVQKVKQLNATLYKRRLALRG